MMQFHCTAQLMLEGERQYDVYSHGRSTVFCQTWYSKDSNRNTYCEMTVRRISNYVTHLPTAAALRLHYCTEAQ